MVFLLGTLAGSIWQEGHFHGDALRPSTSSTIHRHPPDAPLLVARAYRKQTRSGKEAGLDLILGMGLVALPNKQTSQTVKSCSNLVGPDQIRTGSIRLDHVVGMFQYTTPQRNKACKSLTVSRHEETSKHCGVMRVATAARTRRRRRIDR